ncbi:MAG: hypothetical protein KUG76_08250 [Gammaproteobacteria bacterium]|nr:hypothetical protein [Gammaproteobacteria bacterium]
MRCTLFSQKMVINSTLIVSLSIVYLTFPALAEIILGLLFLSIIFAIVARVRSTRINNESIVPSWCVAVVIGIMATFLTFLGFGIGVYSMLSLAVAVGLLVSIAVFQMTRSCV